jgi:hypothetical protein
MPLLTRKYAEKISLEKFALILIVITAFFLRIYELPAKFFTAETHNIFNGLRLHTLDLFNFSDHFSLNFFKSFFGSIAGLRHALSTYLSSTVYGLLGIPLNEFWLRFFYVSLGTLCVVGIYVLGRMLADYRFGLAGAAILAINIDSIARSRSDNAGITVTFFVLICLIALFHYKENPTWIRRTVLSAIIPVVASMESMVFLPLILIYQLLLFVPPETIYSKKIIGCWKYLVSKENILLWLPCFFILLVHYYVYLRIGESHIGLFGYMVFQQDRFYSAVNLLEGFFLNFRLYSIHYSIPGFFYSSLAVLFFLVLGWKKNKFSEVFIYSGIGFFYFFILFILTGSNENTNHLYICTTINVLFLGAIWVSLFDRMKGIFLSKVRMLIVCGLSLLLLVQVLSVFQKVLERQHLIHPLKSLGYYIHEYGGDNPSAYLLLDCGNFNILFNSEFYFGTQIINMGDQYNVPRKLFCIGSQSIESTLAAYKLSDFDFYVAIYGFSAVRTGTGKIEDSLGIIWDQIKSSGKQKVKDGYVNLRTEKTDLKIQELLSKGAKRVAVFRNNGEIMGEIYSRRDLPFKDFEIRESDSLWDQKYANILGIVKTRWVGMASTWGFLWDPVTGI